MPTLPRTAREMLERAREFLERKQLEEARLEAELIVAHALGLERLQLFLDLERPLSAEEVARARGLLMRRAQREPVAYITGRREFYGRGFRVGPGVLVPRPETELIVDRVRERWSDEAGRRPLRIADFGTGSGCLAITLNLELAGSQVCASDVSPEALEYARENARALGAEVGWIEGDGLGAGDGDAHGGLVARVPFDVLVSNPPYVDPATLAELAPDVRDFEPRLALSSPAGDPDYWLRLLLQRAPELIAPGGQLCVELGFDQAERARALASELGIAVELWRDLAGIERVLEARLGDGWAAKDPAAAGRAR